MFNKSKIKKIDYKKLFSYFSKLLFYIFVLFFIYYIINNRYVFIAFKNIRYFYLSINYFIIIPLYLLICGWQTYLLKKIYNVPIKFIQSFYISVETGAYNYILPLGSSIAYRGGLLKVFHTLKMKNFLIYNFFYYFLVYFFISLTVIWNIEGLIYYFFLLILFFSFLSVITLLYFKEKLKFFISKNVLFEIFLSIIVMIVILYSRYFILIFAITGNYLFFSSLLITAVVIISIPLKVTPAGFGIRELLMYYVAHSGNINNIEIIILLDRLIEISVYFTIFGLLKLNKVKLHNN